MVSTYHQKHYRHLFLYGMVPLYHIPAELRHQFYNNPNLLSEGCAHNSYTARNAVQWAVGEGIINGSDGRLLSQGSATRAQVAAILMRFIENVVKR